MRIAVIVSESAAIDNCVRAIKLLFLTSTGELPDCCSPEQHTLEAPIVKLMDDTKALCEKYDEEIAAQQKEFDYERADHQFAQAELDWKRQFYTRFANQAFVARILTARVQVISKRITRQHKTKQVKVLQRKQV